MFPFDPQKHRLCGCVKQARRLDDLGRFPYILLARQFTRRIEIATLQPRTESLAAYRPVLVVLSHGNRNISRTVGSLKQLGVFRQLDQTIHGGGHGCGAPKAHRPLSSGNDLSKND